jgi:hypothetical protein
VCFAFLARGDEPSTPHDVSIATPGPRDLGRPLPAPPSAAVLFTRATSSAASGHRIPPRVRDDRDTPLSVRRDMQIITAAATAGTAMPGEICVQPYFTMGIINSNLVSSGFDTTSRLPLWARAISEAMKSPSPKPC